MSLHRGAPQPATPLTFQGLDDLQLVGEVGPPVGPELEAPQGHDAVRGGEPALQAQGHAVAPPPLLPLLLEEPPLAQVVLPPQGQAPQGQPQVLGPCALLPRAVPAAARAEVD